MWPGGQGWGSAVPESTRRQGRAEGGVWPVPWRMLLGPGPLSPMSPLSFPPSPPAPRCREGRQSAGTRAVTSADLQRLYTSSFRLEILAGGGRAASPEGPAFAKTSTPPQLGAVAPTQEPRYVTLYFTIYPRTYPRARRVHMLDELRLPQKVCGKWDK